MADADPITPRVKREYEKSHKDIMDWIHRLDTSDSKPEHIEEAKAYKKKTDKCLATFRKIMTSPSALLTPEILNHIAENLDPNLIPNAQTRQMTATLSLELVHKSLHNLWLCGRHFLLNDALLDKAVRLWPRVWAWLRYFIQDVVEKGLWGVEMAKTGLGCFGAVVEKFAHHDAFRKVMIDTPGCCEMVTHYWLLEDTLGPLHLEKREDLFSAALPVLLFRGTMHPNFQEVVYAANGRRNIARLTLGRLRAQIEQSDSTFDIQRIFYLVMLLKVLCDHYDPDLQYSFLSQGSLLLMVKLVATLIERKQPRELDHFGSSLIFQMYIHACIGCRETYHGRRWLLQAINAGLIPALLGSAKFTRQFRNQADSQQLLRVFDMVLCPYLIYKDVVRATAKHLERNPIQLEKVHTLVRKKCAYFVELVGKRRRELDGLDAAVLRKCSHCKVQVSQDGASSLKQCRGCQAIRYCSRTCQKLDWQSHKDRCMLGPMKLTGGPDGSYSVPSIYDWSFMTCIMAFEVHARVDEYNAILDKSYAGIPLQNLVFQVDCDETPPRLSVRPHPDIKSYDALALPRPSYRRETEMYPDGDEDLDEIEIQLIFHWGYGDCYSTGCRATRVAPRRLRGVVNGV